jgi:hypothetical protein
LISRRAVSRVLILIAIAGLLLALAMAFGARFWFHAGGVRVRASDPARPLLIAVAAAWTGALLGGPGPARRLGICLAAIASTYVVALNHAFQRAIIRCGDEAWSEHAGVVVELYKRRAQVAVDQSSLFMFGQPLAVNGLERAQYVVHRTDAYTREDDRPGTEVLLGQANVTITRRVCTGPDFARPCVLFE